MQILGLIAVMSWIVMGAAAIEVSRALGKQVCIGRLFLLFPGAMFGGYKNNQTQSQQRGALVLLL